VEDKGLHSLIEVSNTSNITLISINIICYTI